MNKKDLLDYIFTELTSSNDTSNDTYLEIGKNYLIRTVTMIYAGKIAGIKGNEVLLTNCSWIAHTGRFHDNLKSCEFEEVEPYVNEVLLYKTAFLDATPIKTLPTQQK
jgi:hypothetical protein